MFGREQLVLASRFFFWGGGQVGRAGRMEGGTLGSAGKQVFLGDGGGR